MKLLWMNFKTAAEALEKASSGEKILYCLPSSVSREGFFREGYIAVSESRYFTIHNNRIIEEETLSGFDLFRSKTLSGLGRLESAPPAR